MKPSIRRRVVAVASCWVFIFILWWLLSITCCNGTSIKVVDAQDEETTLVAEPALALQEGVATLDDRVEAPRASDRNEILSPASAFQNYTVDMRNTPEEGLPQWLKATGLILNSGEFQKVYFQRWGLSPDQKFGDQESAPHAVYAIWQSRSRGTSYDLLGALLIQVYCEARLDIFKHWLNLLMHHRQPDEIKRIVAELRRYLEISDRKSQDFPARAKEVISTVVLIGGINASLNTEIIAIFSDPECGVVVGDAAGFSALTMLAATVPYSEMAAKIPQLLMSKSKEVQWGVVEMIRFYVYQQQLNGELLADMIPDYLLRQADDVRCSAALELLASFGGENGRQKLLNVAQDAQSPRRGAALSFLAAAGKISIAEVLSFSGSPDMTLSVLGALASLGRAGHTQAYPEIERYLSASDSAIQREAAVILVRAGRMSAQEAARYGI